MNAQATHPHCATRRHYCCVRHRCRLERCAYTASPFVETGICPKTNSTDTQHPSKLSIIRCQRVLLVLSCKKIESSGMHIHGSQRKDACLCDGIYPQKNDTAVVYQVCSIYHWAYAHECCLCAKVHKAKTTTGILRRPKTFSL